MSSPRIRAVETQDLDPDYEESYDDAAPVSYYQQPHNQQSHYQQTEHNDNYYDPMYDDEYSYQQRVIRRIPTSQLLPITRRVTTRKSPRMQCFYRHIPVCLLLDSGAESNLISESKALSLDLQISSTKQGALQADESTPLKIVGEVKSVTLNKGAHVFVMDALVVKSNMSDIVAGEPFMEVNDIAIRPAKQLITIQGKDHIPFESPL